MTDLRGLSMPEQHLLPDSVVAFVDGELPGNAHTRVVSHMQACPGCAAEIAAQRQARAVVRSADAPSLPMGLLAALQAIPQNTELPALPDELAVTQDGQLVAIQRKDRAGRTPLGAAPPLGSSPRLGQGPSVLGRGRRTAQGAGVVVSGLVLGALAFVAPSGGPAATSEPPARQRIPVHAAVPAAAPVLVGVGPIIR
jgi:anti-sigma factor RsiW